MTPCGDRRLSGEAGRGRGSVKLTVPVLAEALTNSGEQTQNHPDTPGEGDFASARGS